MGAMGMTLQRKFVCTGSVWHSEANKADGSEQLGAGSLARSKAGVAHTMAQHHPKRLAEHQYSDTK